MDKINIKESIIAALKKGPITMDELVLAAKASKWTVRNLVYSKKKLGLKIVAEKKDSKTYYSIKNGTKAKIKSIPEPIIPETTTVEVPGGANV